MTREQFLKLKFPILPYCEMTRGPSTQFNESFSIRNDNIGMVLNFFWSFKETISVGTFDMNESNPLKTNETIIENANKLSDEEIEKICRDALS